MGCTVCATRGGAGSRETQAKAVAYAAEKGCRLVFLLVVDTSFYGEVEPVLKEALREELRWIGDTLLYLAQRRAQEAGVEAEVVMREGDALEEIQAFVTETNPDRLLIGAPRGSTDAVFGDDPVERFANKVAYTTGVEVEVVYPK